MTDDPLTVCPECGAEIHRVLYPAGIVFKGSGFYKTDNGSSSPGEKNSSAEKSKSESGTSKTTAESKSSTESSKSDSSGSTASPAAAAAD